MGNVAIQAVPPTNLITRQQILDAIESILPLAGFVDDETVTIGSGGRLALKYCVPRWQKFTVTYSQFSVSATTKDVIIFNLPAAGVVHMVKVKHSTSFSGGSITAYNVSVGLASFTNKYAGAFDVKQAVASNAQQLSSPKAAEDAAAVTAIVAHAAATGGNLNLATAGSVDIWILWSVTL